MKKLNPNKSFGVYFNKSTNKFIVRSFVDKTRVYIGSFNNRYDAAIAYDDFVGKNKLKRRLNFPETESKNLIPNTKLVRLTQGKFAVVDEEDFKSVNQFNWCAAKKPTTYYAVRTIVVNNVETTEPMHRFIMGNPSKDIDHVNGNGLHNYKSNLRECSHSENQRNRRPITNKTSIYKGVCWDKRWGKFRAYIRDSKRLIHIGSSDSDKECALMYDDKARKLFKEFAWLNFPLNN